MNTECFRHSAGKSALIALSIFGLTLLFNAGVRPLCGAQRVAAASVVKHNATITPFTLKTQFRSYEPEDAGIKHLTQLVARRLDGATATLAYRSGDPGKTRMRSIVFLDGRMMEVLDKSRAAANWPANARFAAAANRDFENASRECLHTHGEYVAGHTVLGGVGIVIVKEFPKGSSGMTWWRAPKLGCQALQETYTQVQADGSFRLASETKFVSIELGAPDAALFAVPRSYASVKPSRLLHLEAQQMGQKWNAGLQAQAEQEDAQYAHLQQAARSDH